MESITVDDLRRQEIWRELTILVRVRPDADVFPVRADYDGKGQPTIGANCLSANGGLWFTLADCIASKLHTGKAPVVLEALRFQPGPLQVDLREIDLPGDAGKIDPKSQDFYKELIELRQDIKQRRDAAGEDEYDTLDAQQNALKIAVNATSYGILMEMNVSERSQKTPVTVHTTQDEPFMLDVLNVEEPGRYFHPLLATLIHRRRTPDAFDR